MSTIAGLWQTIETQYTNGSFPKAQLEKIDEFVFSEDIENIRNGLTLMTTIAPEYLCRYLELEGESVVLRDVGRFSAPLNAERVLLESAKSEPMWQGLYESGSFESMEFRVLGDVEIENLSEGEKSFCVRMAKEMVRIPAGDFERNGVKVTLTRDFLMGKYQVTQALWDSVMGSNPSYFKGANFKGANRPVESVSWFDMVEFCNKLSELEGLELAYTINGENVTCNWNAKGYRLPTEAEWEYSARGDEYHKYAGSDNVDEVAWYDGNSGDETHPVGQKKPNGFGLYDMSGNVWEWAWDWLGNYSSDCQTDPTGPDSGSYRMRRGGCWFDWVRDARVSIRTRRDPTIRVSSLGFRLSRITP
jgi:sulfatase modifying factor 1